MNKYIATFGGDGALLLLHGHGQSFRARLPSSVLLLDAGPFQDAIYGGGPQPYPLPADLIDAKNEGLQRRRARLAAASV